MGSIWHSWWTEYLNKYELLLYFFRTLFFKGFYTIFNEKNRKLYAQSSETFEAGKLKAELPTFTMSQVKEHSSLDKGVWIVYKNGVYDITKFIESHPGGSEKISLAAGASIEPFWSIYAVHHKNEVYEINIS